MGTGNALLQQKVNVDSDHEDLTTATQMIQRRG